MGTIAVTGATGYLAEKLIERLITQGHTIHAIARNEGKLIALREKFLSSTYKCNFLGADNKQ